LTYQVVSPYEYGDKIQVDNDDHFDEEAEQNVTTVPRTTANKVVHRFQDIDFLAGLQTTNVVTEIPPTVELTQDNSIVSVITTVSTSFAYFPHSKLIFNYLFSDNLYFIN
jgi:hypothetical protein